MGYWELDPYPAWQHLHKHLGDPLGEVAEHKGKVRQEVLDHEGPMTDEEREAVLAYMAAATNLVQWRGSAGCRLCPSMKEQGVTNLNDHVGHLGSQCLITQDRKWKFPQKWEHYITEHDIRPTKAQFIEDAVAWKERKNERCAEENAGPPEDHRRGRTRGR
jgi:hypothetical protein